MLLLCVVRKALMCVRGKPATTTTNTKRYANVNNTIHPAHNTPLRLQQA